MHHYHLMTEDIIELDEELLKLRLERAWRKK